MPGPLHIFRQWKRQRKLARHAAWRAAPYVSDARPIIVGGCPRSGTTLIRVILDTHPNICCGPETEIFKLGPRNPRRLACNFELPESEVLTMQKQATSQAQFIDEFFDLCCRHAGATRWAEKTPLNIQHLDYIFERFPVAKFIHMIRDGRDTICSLRTHPRHKLVQGKLVPVSTNNPIEQCIDTWVCETQRGLAWRDDPRYRELRYEDIVSDPAGVLRPLFDWLGEPWDPDVLNFHKITSGSREVSKFPQNPEATRKLSAKSVRRWRSDLSIDELTMFYERGADLLRTFGYDVSEIPCRR